MDKLSICILSVDHFPHHLDGIKRVSLILGREWFQQNYNVYYLTFSSSSLHPSHVKKIPHYFFPNTTEINSPENKKFTEDLIRQNRINILLNPHLEEYDLCRLTFEIKKTTKVKLVSVLHFSPNHQYDITRYAYFNLYVLGAKPLKWIKDIILWMRFKLYRGYQIHQQQRERQHEVIKNSDKLVLLSKSYLKYFDSKEREHITFINNPIDNICENKHFNEKEKIVVWCGRLDLTGAKRVDRMLRIWKVLSKSHLDWELYLLGNGNYTLIKNLIRSHSIKNVKVVGFCDPYDYYKKASIVAMTSTAEGFPLVLLEAQQFGCIPIAFNSFDSINDIIEEGETGFLVKPFDNKKYIEKMSYLMNHPKVREKVSHKAKESLCRYNAATISRQWIDLFLSL